MTVLYRMGEKGLRKGYGGTLTHLELPYETVFAFGTDKSPLKKSIQTSQISLDKGTLIDVHPWDVEIHFGENDVYLSFDDIREIQIWKPNEEYHFGIPHKLFKTIYQAPHVLKSYNGKERRVFFDSEWR